ncbi:sodium:proton antiporter [Luteococcus sp. Sow4_B9]|uniref:sodium:proton antiporter n=1 Tax=Luteococcus sp. Sow4_B9 TaxID=3438792 RepID=UPI003F98625D
MAIALIVAALLGGGVYMVLRRGMLRVIVGFIMISHAVNVLIVAAGDVSRRRAAIGNFDPAQTADPVPQAFVLTAIVISFAVTVLLLVLAVIGEGDDDTAIDITGREMESPSLIHHDDAAVSRRHEHSDWHSYIDRTDADE